MCNIFHIIKKCEKIIIGPYSPLIVYDLFPTITSIVYFIYLSKYVQFKFTISSFFMLMSRTNRTEICCPAGVMFFECISLQVC